MAKKKDGRSPLFLMLLGMAGAIAVLVCLVSLDFTWMQLVFYVPGLALSAVLILSGRSRAKKK